MINRTFGALGNSALAVVIFAAVPLWFVLLKSSELGFEQWQKLLSSRLPELLWNTLSLAILVAIVCFVLGVSAAWWIARFDFPGRRYAVWLMVLPLTIPTYVFAHIYTTLFESDGWIGRVWTGIFGGSVAIPDIFNIFGATLTLSLAGFSYVFLMSHAALSVSTQTLEEAARIQGASKWRVFTRINLPLLRPAIAAGLAVVILHVLSDFGAVSMLHYQTFTLSIYLQMSGRFDYHSAAGLSLILVFLSLTFLVLERFFRARQRYYTSRQTRKHQLRQVTPFITMMIWLWLGLITFLAFILPLAWMISWSWDAWMQDVIDQEFWRYAYNSLLLAVLCATLAIACGLPIALFNTRQRSRYSNTLIQISSVGFVLPGPVVALGILTFVLSMLPLLYGGLIALVIALVIRFLPLSVQSQDASMQQLTPSIEQAGRILGATPLENLRRVILPMIGGGIASAWVLVFIDTLKELPATLILRPTGFDTLPVRIWIEASEEMLELAAPAALMLVMGTLPVLWIMMKNERKYSG
ncbi:MAG: iron ABC transporter permease [Gammaproteobacteria bacterium]|nr:iron ABC transporter permease [Gammaproteobacteria bacterium]